MNKMQRLLNLFKQRERTYKEEKKNVTLSEVQNNINNLYDKGELNDGFNTIDGLYDIIDRLYVLSSRLLIESNKHNGYQNIATKVKTSRGGGIEDNKFFLLTVTTEQGDMKYLLNIKEWSNCKFAKTKSGFIIIEDDKDVKDLFNVDKLINLVNKINKHNKHK